MPKICKYPGCNNNVFGKGYCKYHQWCRLDYKPYKYKGKKKDKHTQFGFKNQTELFNYIWDTRSHRSELTDKPLLPKGHPKWHFQFLHVLPKGSYPYYKLNPDNILLGLPDEHVNQEQYEVFREKKQKLLKEYYEKYY